MEKLPTPSHGRFVYRWCVRGGFAVGLLSLAGGLVALAMGLFWDLVLRNEAAFWLAVAALAFGLTALAARPHGSGETE